MKMGEFLKRAGAGKDRLSVYAQRGQLPFPARRGDAYTEEDAASFGLMVRLCDAGLKVEAARRLVMRDMRLAEQTLGLLLQVAPVKDTMKPVPLFEYRPGYWI